MINSMTSVRVSFLEGDTDYPEHFNQYGATLGTLINKSVYITVSHQVAFFDHRIRVSSSKTELTATIDEIQHPSVREVKFNIEDQGSQLIFYRPSGHV